MRRSTVLLLAFCFFLSGSAGLIYQIAWTKALGLTFGHTVYAITTVLAAFMGGIAAGSAILGRWGEGHRRPVALFAKIELLIGATGALSLIGVKVVGALYLTAQRAAPDSTLFLVALRFLAAILVLFPTTFLMGGTLPILTAGMRRSATDLGAWLSRLYWINTAGAVAGAVAAGFLLLPTIGLRLTVLLAVALNVLGGCLALALSRSLAERPDIECPAEKEISGRTIPGLPWFLLGSFALVGATAMAYEIAWSRLLATTLGSSTYAFTVMLATFLAGLALGGRLFEIWVARRPNVSLTAFGVTQTLTGLAAVVFLVIFERLPVILWAVVTATHNTFEGLVVAQFATAALAMLPAAIVFGFNFPLVVLLITRHQKGNAASVGSACAANTVGAILGAIAAGFWLVPLLGSFRLVTFTAAVNLALAAFLMARRVPRRRVALVGNAVLATVVAAGGWFGVLNDPASTTFNVIANRAYYPSSLLLDEITGTSDLVFAEDGLNASISVVRASEFLGLRTNGKVDASTHDTLTQLMVGHLGVLFHPAPKRVLIIGFGSGMTVSAVARYPGVERIDCVEIEPAVLRAASHLEPLNRGVLADPRVHVILNDARNFLMTAGGQYDVIISEPSNPWIAGVASLFTDEFYQQVTTRLAPGGILVQWVQAYSIFPDDLKMVLGTVARRFPQVTAWRGEWADIVLLAQSHRRPLSLDRLRHSWSVPALREDYAALGLNRPEGLLAYHLLDDPELRELSANARHNTDDLTRLEYRAPLALLAVLDRDNMEMFARQPSTPLPASIPVSDKRSALIGTAETTAFLGGSKRDGALFSALSAYPASADGELVRAEWFVKTARPADARDAFSNARRLDPSSPKALVGLAELARAQKEYVTAEEMLREVLGEHPELVSALESYARLERDRKHPVEALAWQRKRVAADPGRGSDALVLLAVMALHAGDIRQAERAAVELLGRDPYNGNAQTMLGELFWRQSRWNEARVHLEAVVRYHPAWSAQNYILLANVYRNLDRMDDAEFTRRKGVRIFPDNARLARAVVPAVTP